MAYMESAQIQTATLTQPGGRTMPKVLVIDDSPSAVYGVREVLEPAGYEVEAVEMIIYLAHQVRDDPPDVILLDLSMPVLSGINVASLIRRFQPRPIPIIIYSSRPSTELRSAAAELGATAYVWKGDSDERLLSAIAGAIAGAMVG